MTTKHVIIGGSLLAAAGLAYYFLVYKKKSQFSGFNSAGNADGHSNAAGSRASECPAGMQPNKDHTRCVKGGAMTVVHPIMQHATVTPNPYNNL